MDSSGSLRLIVDMVGGCTFLSQLRPSKWRKSCKQRPTCKSRWPPTTVQQRSTKSRWYYLRRWRKPRRSRSPKSGGQWPTSIPGWPMEPSKYNCAKIKIKKINVKFKNPTKNFPTKIELAKSFKIDLVKKKNCRQVLRKRWNFLN